MKTFKVVKAQDKKNMNNTTIMGTIEDFPENKKELTEQIKAMNDEQVLTCLDLLEIQVKVFTRPRLEGRTVKFIDIFTLPRRLNIGKALEQVQADMIITQAQINKEVKAGNFKKAQELQPKYEVLEKRLNSLKEKQDSVKAKRQATKTANKAKEDSKPKTSN